MWILTLFDLPMLTAAQRRTYGRFRKFLLKLGFEALQKSVYLRWASSSEAAETFRHEILRQVPQSGTVTVLPFTERTMSLASMAVDGELRPARTIPDEFLVF